MAVKKHSGVAAAKKFSNSGESVAEQFSCSGVGVVLQYSGSQKVAIAVAEIVTAAIGSGSSTVKMTFSLFANINF